MSVSVPRARHSEIFDYRSPGIGWDMPPTGVRAGQAVTSPLYPDRIPGSIMSPALDSRPRKDGGQLSVTSTPRQNAT